MKNISVIEEYCSGDSKFRIINYMRDFLILKNDGFENGFCDVQIINCIKTFIILSLAFLNTDYLITLIREKFTRFLKR